VADVFLDRLEVICELLFADPTAAAGRDEARALLFSGGPLQGTAADSGGVDFA
jgi:hypothetical protein